jgi:hypothetical protein
MRISSGRADCSLMAHIEGRVSRYERTDMMSSPSADRTPLCRGLVPPSIRRSVHRHGARDSRRRNQCLDDEYIAWVGPPSAPQRYLHNGGLCANSTALQRDTSEIFDERSWRLALQAVEPGMTLRTRHTAVSLNSRLCVGRRGTRHTYRQPARSHQHQSSPARVTAPLVSASRYRTVVLRPRVPSSCARLLDATARSCPTARWPAETLRSGEKADWTGIPIALAPGQHGACRPDTKLARGTQECKHQICARDCSAVRWPTHRKHQLRASTEPVRRPTGCQPSTLLQAQAATAAAQDTGRSCRSTQQNLRGRRWAKSDVRLHAPEPVAQATLSDTWLSRVTFDAGAQD